MIEDPRLIFGVVLWLIIFGGIFWLFWGSYNEGVRKRKYTLYFNKNAQNPLIIEKQGSFYDGHKRLFGDFEIRNNELIETAREPPETHEKVYSSNNLDKVIKKYDAILDEYPELRI